jgi:glutaminyl-tRNA synthetase
LRPIIRSSRKLGKRAMPFGRELWIEREDFMAQPSKGYHRLYPGNMARLRYGYVRQMHRLRP